MAIIEMRGIQRFYIMGDIVVKALRGIDLVVEEGEFVAIMGPSGSDRKSVV